MPFMSTDENYCIDKDSDEKSKYIDELHFQCACGNYKIYKTKNCDMFRFDSGYVQQRILNEKFDKYLEKTKTCKCSIGKYGGICDTLETVKKDFEKNNIQIYNNSRDGSHRLLGFYDITKETSDIMKPTYFIEYTLRKNIIPFQMIKKLTAHKLKDIGLETDGVKWVQNLTSIDVFCNDKLIATKIVDRKEETGYYEDFDILIPYNGFLCYQELKIRLNICLNPKITLGYIQSISTVIQTHLWSLEIEGGDLAENKDHPFKWLSIKNNLL